VRGDKKDKVPRHYAASIGLNSPEVRFAAQTPAAIERRAQGYFL
jgi:hypothetical protein